MTSLKKSIGYATLTTAVLTGAWAIVASTTAFGAAPGVPDHTSIASPLLTQTVGTYEGKWAVEEGHVIESFEEAGVLVSTGSVDREEGLSTGSVISFGVVAGFESFATGENYAQLSGQAGTGVTAVRVKSASGVVTSAALEDGIWGAVWDAGDGADEYGAATIEFDTADGTVSASTDDLNLLAGRN